MGNFAPLSGFLSRPFLATGSIISDTEIHAKRPHVAGEEVSVPMEYLASEVAFFHTAE